MVRTVLYLLGRNRKLLAASVDTNWVCVPLQQGLALRRAGFRFWLSMGGHSAPYCVFRMQSSKASVLAFLVFYPRCNRGWSGA